MTKRHFITVTSTLSEERKKEVLTEEKKAILFYFENSEEYNIFLKQEHEKLPFHWEATSTKYTDMVKYADDLFDQGRTEEALNAYVACLAINPVAIRARYSIVDCLKALSRPCEAKTEILKMKWFFSEYHDIAYYYRHLGNVLIDTNELESAYACYKYSLYFEECQNAYDGMSLVEEMSMCPFKALDSESVLKSSSYLSYGVPYC